MHRTIAVAALCLAVAPLVAAATIYKVRMPDGTILFTDSPPPGGKIIEEREATPSPRPAPRLAAPPARAPSSSTSNQNAPAAAGTTSGTATPTTLEAAFAEATEAERELAAARRRLEAGREPMPGERTGTARGGSRLTPEYENRIAGLERDVTAAEERVKRAYETRNSMR